MSSKQGGAGRRKFTIWSDESAEVPPTVTASDVYKLKADALEALARFEALSRGTAAAAPARRSPSPSSSGSRSPSPLRALFSSLQNSSPPRAIYMPTATKSKRECCAIWAFPLHSACCVSRPVACHLSGANSFPLPSLLLSLPPPPPPRLPQSRLLRVSLCTL